MKDENEHMEEIDNLISNASAYEEYSVRESDWDQLAGMLDDHDRRRKALWIWRGVTGLVLIGVVLLLILPWSTNTDEIVETKLTVASKTEKKPIIKEDIKIDNMARTQDAPKTASEKDVQPINQMEEGVVSKPKSVHKTAIIQQQMEEPEQTVITMLANEPSAAIESVQILNDEAKDNVNLPLVEKTNSDTANTFEEETSKEDITIVESDEVAPDTISSKAESVAINKVEDELPPITAVDSTILVACPVNRRLYLSIGAGIERSSVTQMAVGPTQLKLHLGGEYLFNRHWSILSGLNYTVKDYETNTEAYTVQPGFWTNGIKPTRILAECQVLETPLNLRYYFSTQQITSNSFYLSAGASSYLMASEQYRFTYAIVDPTLRPEWNGKWENNHFFSVLNLSAGYQKMLNNNWALLAEPYVHLPLTGIGFGQVDLMSFGLAVKFKY